MHPSTKLVNSIYRFPRLYLLLYRAININLYWLHCCRPPLVHLYCPSTKRIGKKFIFFHKSQSSCRITERTVYILRFSASCLYTSLGVHSFENNSFRLIFKMLGYWDLVKFGNIFNYAEYRNGCTHAVDFGWDERYAIIHPDFTRKPPFCGRPYVPFSLPFVFVPIFRFKGIVTIFTQLS